MGLLRFFRRSADESTTMPTAGGYRAPATDLDEECLAHMDWLSFEKMAELYFVSLGATVVAESSEDGAVLRLFRNGSTLPYGLAKCLARATPDQDHKSLLAFAEQLGAQGIARGMLIANHVFADDVRASAQQCGIKLVDLPSFWAMISALGPAQVAPLRAYVQESDVFAPTCPHCALSLRERVARTGRRFMACPNYPRCQYSPLQALKNTADRLQAAPPQN